MNRALICRRTCKVRWLLVPIVFVAALSAFAAPVRLGPEVPVSAATIGPAPYDQTSPVIAFNGETYLAVWNDGRRGPLSPASLFARKLGVDGVPVGSGRWIKEEGSPPGAAVLASDGQDYLIAYGIDGGATAVRELDADGWAIGPLRTVPSFWPREIASNGDTYLLISGDQSPFTPDTVTVLDHSGQTIKSFQTSLKVATGGVGVHDGNYVLVASDWSACNPSIVCTQPWRIVIETVSAAGNLVQTRETGVSLSGLRGLAVAFSPSSIFIVWSGYVSTEPSSSGFTIIGYDASIGIPARILQSLSAYGSGLTAGWDGTQFAVSAATSNGAIELVRVTTSGVDLAPVQFVVSGYAPNFASAGGRTTLIWNAADDVFSRTVDSFDEVAANPGISELLSSTAPAQIEPDIASSGSHRMIVWTEMSPDSTIVASIDGQTRQVSNDAGGDFQASVAAGRASFAATWINPTTGITLRLFGFDGSAAGAQILPGEAYWPGAPVIAFNGGAFAVAFPFVRDIQVVRVEEDGTPIDNAPQTVIEAGNDTFVFSPTIAGSGSEFVVAASGFLVCGLSDDSRCGPKPAHLWSARIPAIGVSARPVSPVYSAGSFGSQPNNVFYIAAAAGPDDETVLAWIDHYWDQPEDYPGQRQFLSLMKLDASGRLVIAPRRVVPLQWHYAVGAQALYMQPDVVWNGAEYVAAWSETKPDSNNAYVIRLDRNLNPIDSDPILVATQISDGRVRVAKTETGVTIAYSRLDESLGVPRVFTRDLDRIDWIPRRRAAHH